MPYFQKIRQADIFVILGHVQFEKNNYQNRFFHEGQWYTMSVERGMCPINQKYYFNALTDWKRITDKLPKLKVFDNCISENLLKTNSLIIKKSCEILGIKTRIVTDYATDLRGTDRLVDLCKNYNCDKYVSGISGTNYLQKESFDKAGITVVYQNEGEMDKRSLITAL